jgi:uncharacterized protein (TIGR00251 family)
MKKRDAGVTFFDFEAKIIPKSSRNEIITLDGGIIKIKVTAPPVDGMANRAVIELISKELKIPRKDIAIISGDKSKNKKIRVHGVSHLDFQKVES